MTAPPDRPRPSFICYGIFDKTTDPMTLLEVKLSRSEARKTVQFREDADQLRIRRARLTPYES